jgi:hypothetical protein
MGTAAEVARYVSRRDSAAVELLTVRTNVLRCWGRPRLCATLAPLHLLPLRHTRIRGREHPSLVAVDGMPKLSERQAIELLNTADSGGSNGARVRLWKWELQRFADEMGLQISVCHLPPGTSKVEQDRTPVALLHQPELAWQATDSHEVDYQPRRRRYFEARVGGES